MKTRYTPASGGLLTGGLLAVVLAAGTPAAGFAQTPGQAVQIPSVAPVTVGPDITPASCNSCGLPPLQQVSPGVYGYGKRYAGGGCGPDGCADGDPGCGEAGCVPGRSPCVTCEGHNRVGRLFCAFHNALCCPDPCYEPRWVDAANAAFFVDSARPYSMTRLRWDAGRNMIQPDRAEYFWAAIGKKGPPKPETGLNYNELSLYVEAATERFSFFINTPYRNVDADVNGGSGGFGDLVLGTKSLFLDSELLQMTFQFTTSIPVGVAGRGIGVGHVNLVPSLLASVKLYPDTYWQSQLSYVIPVSGTPGFAGSVLEYRNALNHVLCRPLPDTALIGTIEGVGYTFTSGSFTDAGGVVRSANDQTYFTLGPGLRLCICDKVDFGIGIQFAVTSFHFADQLYRTELRWRF